MTISQSTFTVHFKLPEFGLFADICSLTEAVNLDFNILLSISQNSGK